MSDEIHTGSIDQRSALKSLSKEEWPQVELTDEEVAQLAEAPTLSEFQRSKLDKDSKKNWDLFYKRNGDRFFKNRYWTKHEFQELFSDRNDMNGANKLRFLLEIGCGCGDFVLPLLSHDSEAAVVQISEKSCDSRDSNDQVGLSIYCCDISDIAIEILKSNSIYKENSPTRIKAFVADITEEPSNRLVEGTDGRLMDVVSLIFVLSALDPNNMLAAIENVYSLLRPGGLVLFRDYAIYDKAMLRFSVGSKICDQFYVRHDGTRAYFLSKEQLLGLFEKCNFHCQSIDYVRRATINNATKDKFSRIFLQAKFRRLPIA